MPSLCSLLFLLAGMWREGGVTVTILDYRMETTCQSHMLEGPWVPDVVELPYCPGLFMLRFLHVREITYNG